MRIANNNGYKLSIFSYSMGVPEPHEWDAIADTGVLQMAEAGGHSISLHEYGVMPTDIGSLLGRYEVLTDILKAYRLDIPIYITEWAPDAWTLKPFTDDALMAQVAAYDALVAQNPYIAGIHTFTVGGFGSWPQFDQRWVKLYPRFTQYFDSVKGRVNA